ncbi:hypothetical protein ACS0TY_002728 [Phlomoides rotata]
MVKFNRVCVGCGSNLGYRKIFSDAALDLGQELVKRKMDLVYGGGSVDLMGLLSQIMMGDAMFLGNIFIFIYINYSMLVIPTTLVPVEISGHTVGDEMVVSDMHEKKADMDIT